MPRSGSNQGLRGAGNTAGGSYQSVEIHADADDIPRVSLRGVDAAANNPSLWNRITGRLDGGGVDGRGPLIKGGLALLIACACFAMGLLVGNARGENYEERMINPYLPQVCM